MSDDRDAPKPAAAPADAADAQEAACKANSHNYALAIALGAMSHEDVSEAIRRDYPLYWARLSGTAPPPAADTVKASGEREPDAKPGD